MRPRFGSETTDRGAANAVITGERFRSNWRSRSLVEESTGVEVFVVFDVGLAIWGQSAKDLCGEGKGREAIGGDDGAVSNRRQRPIEFGAAIGANMLTEKVTAVAGMKTIVEKAGVS